MLAVVTGYQKHGRNIVRCVKTLLRSSAHVNG